MKLRLTMALAICAALVAVPTAALGNSSQAATNAQNYPDSVGEDAAAPDITSIDVSNDDAGNITFKVNVSNRPALTSDMLMLLFLDTDQNSSTGSLEDFGSDYAIQLEPGAVGLFQWNGSDFVFADSQTSLTYSYDATGPTIRINRSDLNATKGFNFGMILFSGFVVDAQGNLDDTNVHGDLAPDAGHGFFAYKVIAKVTLTQTAFSVSPSPAKAGKRVSASLAATESDTGGPVTAGTVTCSATVGTKHLTATHALANGVASCFWKVPAAKTKGKLLHGKISLTVQGTTLTKTFTVRVR